MGLWRLSSYRLSAWRVLDRLAGDHMEAGKLRSAPHATSSSAVIKEEMSALLLLLMLLHESESIVQTICRYQKVVLSPVCQVGCGGIASDKDILACLRQASAQDLTTQQFSVSTIGAAINSAFHPTLDNRFITRPPAELLRTGQFQKKDILVGANSNEGSYFLIYMLPDLFGPPKWSANITSSQYSDAVRSLSVVNTSKAFVLKALEFEYSKPCGASYWSSDYEASLDLLLGDAIFTCTVVNFARTFATDVRTKTFLCRNVKNLRLLSTRHFIDNCVTELKTKSTK